MLTLYVAKQKSYATFIIAIRDKMYKNVQGWRSGRKGGEFLFVVRFFVSDQQKYNMWFGEAQGHLL